MPHDSQMATSGSGTQDIVCVVFRVIWYNFHRDRIYDPDFYSSPGLIINRF